MSTDGNPPEGWYPDPNDGAQQRFWDGNGWTEQTRTGAAETPTEALPIDPTATTTLGAAGATPPPPPPGGATPPPPPPGAGAPTAAFGATPPGPPPGPPGPPPGAGAGGGSGGGKGKTIGLIVGAIAVLALIGGGLAVALGGGGDDNEALDEDDFADAVEDACADADSAFEDAFDDLDVADPDEFEDVDEDDLADVQEQIDDARAEVIEALDGIEPEDDPEDWQELVDDLDAAIGSLSDVFDDPDGDDLEDSLFDVLDAFEAIADEYELECISDGSMGGDDPQPTTTIEIDPPSTTTTTPPANFGPPSPPPANIADPEEAALAEECFQGDMAACDDLWLTTGIGSPEEAYAESCGGRSDEDLSNDCEATILNPILPSGGTGSTGGSESDPPSAPPSTSDDELVEFIEGCFQGDMASCDTLWIRTDIGSAEEAYAETCGGRVDPQGPSRCEERVPNPATP